MTYEATRGTVGLTDLPAVSFGNSKVAVAGGVVEHDSDTALNNAVRRIWIAVGEGDP